MSEVNPQPSHDTTTDPFTWVLVDKSHDADENARDEADARLTAELNKPQTFIKRMVNSVWKGNIGYDHYRQKYIREARREIDESQDIYVHTADEVASERAQMATIERFQSELDEAIHTEAGEQRKELAPDSEVAGVVKDLIRRYVNGELNEAALREENTRMIAAFRETRGSELLGPQKHSIDNTITLAQAVKGAVEHGESLDRVIDGMKIISGEARSGVRTESKLGYNTVDKVIDKVNNSRIGSLVQPEIVVSAASIAAIALRMGSKTVTGALVRSVTFGSIGGVWAGLRENKRMKDERGQHMREMAQGKEYDPSAARREEMEKTRYETATASELTEALRSRLDPESLDSNDALQAALDQLSVVETRVSISDSRKIDLITYSAPEAVEEERWALDIARAQAKTTLNYRLDADVRRALGLDEHASLDEILDARSEPFLDDTEEDITTKDGEFKRIKNRAVRHAAVKGAIFGIVGGMIAQEAMATVLDSRVGVVDGLMHAHSAQVDGTQHQTMLYGLLHGDHATHTVPGAPGTHDVQVGSHTEYTTVGYAPHDISQHMNASSTYDSYNIGDHGHISISDDHSVHMNNDGTISLIDSNGNATIDHLAVNPDGTFPPSSIDVLHSHGMTVVGHTDTIDNTTPSVQTVSLDEYMTHHQDSTLQIQRDGYYFNGTPPDCVGPNSNLNELGLGWGGTDGSGITPDGGFQMSVASMTHDGSFQGGNSVDWQEAAQTGHLRLLVTPSYGTQTVPIDLPVNPDGTIDIAPGSAAAQFFSVQDGHAVINAQFVEVAQVTDVDASGVTHVAILATAPGTGGVTELQDTVMQHQDIHVPNYTITTNGYEDITHGSVPIQVPHSVVDYQSVPNESVTVSEPVFTEMAPVIPIVPRRPLESMRSREREGIGGYYGDRYGSSEATRARREETSPRLLTDPEARLKPLEELTWYRDLVHKKRGRKYEAEIDGLIAASPELSNLPTSIKSIVTIPVYAAGNAESTRIYNLLKAYASQDSDAVSHNVMLLHLNWPDDANDDPVKVAAIAKTREEVERARNDFKQLKIATIESEWERKKYKEGAIGYITQRMNDTALLALQSAMRSRHLPPDKDVLIIRNDADAIGLNRNYLKFYQADSEHHDEADIFTGTTSFDTTKARQMPGMVAAATFDRFLDTISAMREGRGHTAGANFGVRASTLAAVGSTGFGTYGGAGSDDVEIGRRINGARGARTGAYGYAGRTTTGSSSRGAGVPAGRTGSRSAKKDISRRVVGARIDTDSDRQEALYRRGIPMSAAWSNGRFDRGGYAERDADLSTAPEIDDNPRRNPDGVVERMRNDMNASIQGYSMATVRTALTFTFAGLKPSASSGYVLRQLGGSRYQLDFTDSGKQFLLNALTRDSKGRFDSYGDRKMRTNYEGTINRLKRKTLPDGTVIKLGEHEASVRPAPLIKVA